MSRKLGLPPADLKALPIDLRSFAGDLWRVHQLAAGRPAWNELRHFGPVRSMRFDPQSPPPAAGKPEGVQYLAATAATALAETFQNGRRLVTTRSDLVLLQWQPVRTLTLLDLNGQFGIRNGGAATLAAGPKRFTQPWARAIHLSIPGIDGLWHRSAMTGADLVTLFTPSEADPVWPVAPSFNRRLDDAALSGFLLAAAEEIGYAIT